MSLAAKTGRLLAVGLGADNIEAMRPPVLVPAITSK